MELGTEIKEHARDMERAKSASPILTSSQNSGGLMGAFSSIIDSAVRHLSGEDLSASPHSDFYEYQIEDILTHNCL